MPIACGRPQLIGISWARRIGSPPLLVRLPASPGLVYTRQGNALGLSCKNIPSPERASHERLHTYVAPIQGLDRCWDPVPRAVPWAIILRPVGAEESGAFLCALHQHDDTQKLTFMGLTLAPPFS